MNFTTVKTIQFHKSDIHFAILDIMEDYLQFKDNTSLGEKIFFGDVFEQIETNNSNEFFVIWNDEHPEAVEQLKQLIELSKGFEYVHLLGE